MIKITEPHFISDFGDVQLGGLEDSNGGNGNLSEKAAGFSLMI